MTSTAELVADVVVVGAGAGGAAAALAAADGGRRVLVAVKGELPGGATAWAQGGLAAAIDPADSVEAHVRDTVLAGAGLCDETVVRGVIAAAPTAVTDLRRAGARFDGPGRTPVGETGPLALTREGGHSRDRIVHAGGAATGREVARTLVDALRAHPRVRVNERSLVLDLLLDGRGGVAGLLVARLDDAGRVSSIEQWRTRAVVLATGGLGQAFAVTTNPAGATGGGLGLGLRAGATVADAEFVQFHPTALWVGPGRRGQQVLVSEAVRGAGAVIVDATGARVMAGVHPLADLAPRDVVAAAMHARMTAAPGGVGDHLWLDATMLGRDGWRQRFPSILERLLEAGVDPAREPIPVAPAAHYSCGGVLADLDGVTGVPGLAAVGEVACTGLHGANRLASNSLTEALVAGRRTGERLAHALPAAPRGELQRPAGATVVDPAQRERIAAATSAGAGMARTADGLAGLLTTLEAVPVVEHGSGSAGVHRGSLDDAHGGFLAAVEAAEIRMAAQVVAGAAKARTESRGCHRRADFPATATHPYRVLTTLRDGALHVSVSPVTVAA